MGEQNTAPETGAPEQTPEPGTPDTPTDQSTPIQLPDDHPLVKAHQANKDELKRLRDEKKSDIQRVTDDLEAERKRASNLETEVLQLRAALKHHIPLEDLDLLGTGTAEEIESRAQRLANRDANRKKQGNVVPTEGSTTPPKPNDETAFVRQLFGPGA